MDDTQLQGGYDTFLSNLAQAEHLVTLARAQSRSRVNMKRRRELWYTCLGFRAEILSPRHGPELTMIHAARIEALIDAARDELG